MNSFLALVLLVIGGFISLAVWVVFMIFMINLSLDYVGDGPTHWIVLVCGVILTLSVPTAVISKIVEKELGI